MSHRISVIIPVHNAEPYLVAAIESVIGQSLPADEIILIDDASTDGTPGIIEQYASQYVHLMRWERLPEQHGAAAARNRGIELANGELLAFLDADDVWVPNKLAMQASALDSDLFTDMAFGYVQQFISPELSEAERGEIRLDRPLLPGLLPGTMLIRRSSLVRVGPFDDSLTVGEFIEWYVRARRLGLVDLMCSEVVLLRRLHQTNLTRRIGEYKDYLRILKSVIDDKRRVSSLPPLLRHIIETQVVVSATGQKLPLFAHLDEDNCYVLQHLLKETRATRILEVGFAYGISAMAIAATVAANPNVDYHIVDPYQHKLWDAIGIENMRRSGFGACYTLHEEGSETVLPRLYANGARFDFAFIDGNHTFDHVLVDFFYTNKMLEIGGIVVFDDVTMPSQIRLMKHIGTYPAYERVPIPAELIMGGVTKPLRYTDRMAAFRKTAHDQRPWDWDEPF